jgi:acyl carrier protein
MLSEATMLVSFYLNSVKNEEEWSRMIEDGVQKAITSIISDVSGFDENEITQDQNFFTDLEIDSIKAIEITVAIEKKFKISVRDEDVPKITTVKQAVELTKKLIGQNKA